MAAEIFINLSVKNLRHTTEFFSKIGFSFHPRYANENTACMIIGDNVFARFMDEAYFHTIHNKQITEIQKEPEMHLIIDMDSRSKVDSIIEKVVKYGGREFRELQDHGWMYTRRFQDPDGHLWEVMCMNAKAIPLLQVQALGEVWISD
jgi:uncharacterized protein